MQMQVAGNLFKIKQNTYYISITHSVNILMGRKLCIELYSDNTERKEGTK